MTLGLLCQQGVDRRPERVVDGSAHRLRSYYSRCVPDPFQYATVLSELDEHGVRTITLDRPGSLNAMNRQLVDDVARAFDDANADPDTRAIVFTGAGRAFCAGDDRKEHTPPADEAEARDLVDAIQRATEAIVFGANPVVGAINGWAVGGGFEWAINCDFPIWAEGAKGFFPEVSLNLFVTGAVTSLLPALVGLNTAREMLFLGQRYGAAELLRLGVAWRVVPDDSLIDEANAVARQLAALPTLSVRAMRRVLNRTASTDLRAALAHETEATVAGFLDPLTTRLLSDFG
jgi:enoyl-CoA hydratase/carnithine racemase